jgi:hypothetical protein
MGVMSLYSPSRPAAAIAAARRAHESATLLLCSA